MSILSTAFNQTNAAASTSSGSSSSGASTAQAAGTNASQQLAGNFDTFLQLLTTQLQNQDPLSPLDTNQFTQQLVEFASVEQQVNMNTNLQTLISMQQTTEATSALQLVGSTVTVSGNTAPLSNATSTPAAWSLTTSTPATANVTVTSSVGSTVYTGTMALNAGTQSFKWTGQGNNARLARRNLHALDQCDRGKRPGCHRDHAGARHRQRREHPSNPPTVTVGGQNIAISQIQSISNSALASLTSLNATLNRLTHIYLPKYLPLPPRNGGAYLRAVPSHRRTPRRNRKLALSNCGQLSASLRQILSRCA